MHSTTIDSNAVAHHAIPPVKSENSLLGGAKEVLFTQHLGESKSLRIGTFVRFEPQRIVRHIGTKLENAQFEVEWKANKNVRPSNSNCQYY